MNNNTESQADYFRVVGPKTERCKHCGLESAFLDIGYGHAGNCPMNKHTDNQCTSQATIGVGPFTSDYYYPVHTKGVSDPGACHSVHYPDSNIKINTRKQVTYREQILIDALNKAKKELQVFNMGTQFVDDVVGLFE